MAAFSSALGPQEKKTAEHTAAVKRTGNMRITFWFYGKGKLFGK